jgi:hypothetical protein
MKKNRLPRKLIFQTTFAKNKSDLAKKGWKIIASFTTIEVCMLLEGLSFCSFVTMCNFEKKLDKKIYEFS